MIRFVYGDLGCGKSKYITDRMVLDAEKGEKVLLIVPEQATVCAERDLLSRLPARARLSADVLNFSRLCDAVFRRYGGGAYERASEGVRKIIVWRALREASPFLREYSLRAADDVPLTEKMLAAIDEFALGGTSAQDLDNALRRLPAGKLADKVRDLSLVYSIYCGLLEPKYSTEVTSMQKAADILEKEDYFAEVNVYIDAFTSFTSPEHRIIRAAMAKAKNVTVTIPLPSPTHRGTDTLSIRACSDKLRAAAAATGAPVQSVCLEERSRADSATLQYTAKDLWTTRDGVRPQNDGSIELWRSDDIYDEVEYAAARIRELLENGCRCRDVALIVRRADTYRGIIEPALEEMGVPYYFAQRTSLASTAPARLIISALRIALYGWRREDVIAHLKTGLCGVDPRDADMFEYYVAKWQISGNRFTVNEPWNMNPDGYTDKISRRGETVLAAANRVRTKITGALEDYFSALKAADSAAGMCRATAEYLERVGLDDSLRNIAAKHLGAGRLRYANETSRLYAATLDALDELCEAFDGAPKPDLSTFACALRMLLGSTDIGTIPTSVDEVNVLEANMMRADNVKYVVILGCVDGEFPAAVTDSGLLSENERALLAEFLSDAGKSRAERASDELFYFRRAVASARCGVMISSHGPTPPSAAFERIRALLSVSVTDASGDILRRIRTPRAAAEYAPLLYGSAIGGAVDEALSQLKGESFRIGSAAEPPVCAANDAISPAVALSAVGKDLVLSQSRTEDFANCRFMYACKYLLSLDDGKKVEFSFDSIGTFIHSVLENALFEIFAVRGGELPGAVEREELIASCAEKYVKEHLPQDIGDRKMRIAHLTERCRRLASLVLTDLVAEFEDSAFRPEFFELKIGRGGVPSPVLDTAGGNRVSITGVVDRVDVFRSEGKAYIRTVDYKTGNKTFNLKNIGDGKDLQLLLYLYSLTSPNDAVKNKLGGEPLPAGISYYTATPPTVELAALDDPTVRERARLELRRSGLWLDDETVLGAASAEGNTRHLMASGKKATVPSVSREGFDRLFSQVCDTVCAVADDIAAGHAEARPRDARTCEFCPFFCICRVGARGKGA